jgi:PPOX class probable F420-dependent enzyme
VIDFNSELGREAKRLLESEYVIWFTTVSKDLTPQPRPVWFIWDANAVLVFSRPAAAKVAHIRRNPRVALHFNSDHGANENVLVMIGAASLHTQPASEVAAYIQKYKEGMAELDMTPESFASQYSVAVRIAIEQVRSF